MAISKTLSIKLQRIEDKFRKKGKFVIRSREVLYLCSQADEIAENEGSVLLKYDIGKEDVFLRIGIGLFYYVNDFYIISQ